MPEIPFSFVVPLSGLWKMGSVVGAPGSPLNRVASPLLGARMSRLNARYHLEAIVIDSGLPAKAKTPARDFALIFLLQSETTCSF